MVFFTCECCGEALKKNQVIKHTYRCRSRYFSCIDCQKVFDEVSFQEHIKCVSEDQKYGGANFVTKECKGEVRQNAWVEQVSQAIEQVKDPQLKKLLNKIKGHNNVPRKEAKFVNFLKNCLKIRDERLSKSAWVAIVANKPKEESKEEPKKE